MPIAACKAMQFLPTVSNRGQYLGADGTGADLGIVRNSYAMRSVQDYPQAPLIPPLMYENEREKTAGPA